MPSQRKTVLEKSNKPAGSRQSILAFDSSGEALHVGLLYEGRKFVRSRSGGADASATFLPLLAAIFEEAGTELSQLAAIAFGAGPGSFTGVRTSVAVAQGLAVGTDVELIPMNGLEVLVHRAVQSGIESRWIAPIIDARMNEVYFALYENVAGELRCVVSASVAGPAQACARIDAAANNDWIAVGAAHLLGRNNALDIDRGIDASALLSRAQTLYRTGVRVTAEQAQPIYIRDKVALTLAERQAQAVA